MHHTKAEVLVASARGLANFETVKKSAEELIYDCLKGCPKHWTVLHFILELLTLKAKHSWSDRSFNDLLHILDWLLPKPNKVPANTYRANKLVSPFTMGVERIHAYPNHCILYRGDTFKDLKKCHVCCWHSLAYMNYSARAQRPIVAFTREYTYDIESKER